MGAHSTTSGGSILAPAEEGRRHEVLGLLAAAATLLTTLSLMSFGTGAAENLVGPLGTSGADLLASAFGVAAWWIPIELGLLTIRLFSKRAALLGLATLASTLVIVLVSCAMLHLLLSGQTVFGDHLPGGLLGEVLGEVLRSIVGLAGAYVVGATTLLVTMVLRTPVSVTHSLKRAGGGLRAGYDRVRDGGRALAEAWREAREIEREELESARLADAPRITGLDDVEEDGEALILSDEDRDSVTPEPQPDEPADTLEVKPEDEAKPKAKAKKTRAKKKSEAEGPRIVAPKKKSEKPTEALSIDTAPPSRHGPYVLPPTSLLDEPPETEVTVDADTLRENAARLTEKLAAYGVKGRVDEIHPGPVVTMYEFEPQSGTKISKIAGLSDDLAMALAAQKVRIVAPIPGKARVGFELPNDVRLTVHLREVLEDERWNKLKANLPIALGKDIAGQPVYGDLSRMPHLLVAGATGSGKSVGLNVMLASLLMRKTPEEVRMLMIDPKVVELAVFDGIPHMLLPVVTDMKKASLALRWAVDEMERRYQLFADAGARNIGTFNQRVQKVLDGDLAHEKLFPSRKGKMRAQGPNGEEVLVLPDGDEQPDALAEPPEKLPYVVVVVDEFADLMMVAAKDVESAIARLAQKARAAGIHVILATQRPSVDVITGMIKANFPARMAFKVSQREDSKTILGRMGAEQLLGMGDMLMIPPGSSDLHRVHSAYISEDEVKVICDHLREQGKPKYDEKILEPRDDEDSSGGAKTDDPVYDRAVAVVAQAGYCSISHIQRQLSVGYNKAAKLVDRMEKEGVVGPAASKAGGRREVLVTAI
ncbi:MAG: DUF87 domain-containing protein [Deltaproteobacteria bacterium]|nr:DUF87 domain-containing protein [Deltaproteobacteria bacterium]